MAASNVSLDVPNEWVDNNGHIFTVTSIDKAVVEKGSVAAAESDEWLNLFGTTACPADTDCGCGFLKHGPRAYGPVLCTPAALASGEMFGWTRRDVTPWWERADTDDDLDDEGTEA